MPKLLKNLVSSIVAKFLLAMANRKGHSNKVVDDPFRKARINVADFTGGGKKIPAEFTPIDCRADMPTNPNPKRVYYTRPITKIDTIIVHQAMSRGSIAGVANYHRTPTYVDEKTNVIIKNHLSDRGAPGIAYHFGIEADSSGTVKWVQDLESVVWGVKGMNSRSIHILVMGDFDGGGYRGKDGKPSSQQLENLEKLISWVKSRVPWVKDRVFPHSDFGKKACPGYVIEDRLMWTRKAIEQGEM